MTEESRQVPPTDMTTRFNIWLRTVYSTEWKDTTPSMFAELLQVAVDFIFPGGDPQEVEVDKNQLSIEAVLAEALKGDSPTPDSSGGYL